MARTPHIDLPPTLAQRVRFLRERRYMTAELLAIKAQLPLKQVEDIEEGIETFLAPSIRMRLARVLQVRPGQLKEVENTPPVTTEELVQASYLQSKGMDLLEAIRRNPDGDYRCPNCEAPLNVRVFQRRDLQDRPLEVIKAHCTKCLFRLTDD